MNKIQFVLGGARAIGSVAVSRRPARDLDLSFEIYNGSIWNVELVAIERDVRSADGSLLERRAVDANTPVRSGATRMIPNPMAESTVRVPLGTVVYRFAFHRLPATAQA